MHEVVKVKWRDRQVGKQLETIGRIVAHSQSMLVVDNGEANVYIPVLAISSTEPFIKVQEVWLQHDWLYASKDLIPPESLDGKETPELTFIITREPISAAHSDGYGLFNTMRELLSDLH